MATSRLTSSIVFSFPQPQMAMFIDEGIFHCDVNMNQGSVRTNALN